MTPFDFVFTLYGLLLGLSLVEVLGGLGRTIEVRLRPGTDFRIGWLTPLLGIFVMLDLVSFWSAAWTVRELLSVNWTTLVASMGFASLYYLAAHLVFPSTLEDITDLDAHYFRVRRLVLGTLTGLLAVQLLYFATIPVLAQVLLRPHTLVQAGLLVVLLIGALVARGRRISAVLLVALVLRYLIPAMLM